MGEPEAQNILDRIRASPVVHADETGWGQDGVNGYVWTFSTPTERYFRRRGRNKEVVDEAARNVAGNWLQPGGQLYLGHQETARA